MKTWLACLALYFSESWRDSAINFPFPRAEFVFRTKKKLGPPPPPRDKAILPVFESSIIGAARLSCLIFSRYTEGAQQYTGRVPAARERPPTPPPLPTPLPQRNYWSTVGVIAVIAPPETDRSSNYSKAFSIPLCRLSLPPPPLILLLLHHPPRYEDGWKEGGGDGGWEAAEEGTREKEHKTWKERRGGGGGEGGPPFIPETELPVRSHSTNLGS